jgi:hypothetical protein
MQKKEVYAELSAKIAGITIIAIVRVTFSCWYKSQAISFSGQKQPIGVIVLSPFYKKGFDMSGEETPLDGFIQEIPELKSIIDNY